MLLQAGEKAVADLGYRGEPATINLPEEGTQEWIYRMAVARARHETCNRRFKQWNILQHRFRHNVDDHTTYFTAVAVITQLQIETTSPLFELN